MTAPTRTPIAAAPVTADSPWRFYDALLQDLRAAHSRDAMIEEVMIGLTWTLCRSRQASGLAMSPEVSTRTLPWSGSLAGRPALELADWIKSWQPHEASIGMAAINTLLNAANPMQDAATPLFPQGPANLAVFEHFRPQLAGKRVVVVGRYPGLSALEAEMELTVVERKPDANDLPDPALEYLLPQADWVFLTATSLVNKTFPRLAELSAQAQLVLMGPTAPWWAGLRDYGVDYLAGVITQDDDTLSTTVAEGGGTRIFDTAVSYAVLDLRLEEVDQYRSAIAAVYARREALKQAMYDWYGQGKRHYPGAFELSRLDLQLSQLDSAFKQRWDRQQLAAG